MFIPLSDPFLPELPVHRFISPVAVLILALVSTPAAAQTKGVKLPEGTAEHRDLRYGDHKERNTLDLFVPKSDKPLPLIIWVHGGAWQGGSKDGHQPRAAVPREGLCSRGHQLPAQPARGLPGSDPGLQGSRPLPPRDAKKYNLDPDRFGAWGASAGGHLVALLGTTGGEKELDAEGQSAQ